MSQKGRILIADDEETFLQATGALLRREGYECDCVSDGDAAIKRLRASRYDLLISDIKMPGNADLAFIKQVPQIAPGLPVIMVTGYPSLESAIQSIELPVVAYLVKPVDFNQLLSQIRISIQNGRLQGASNPVDQNIQEWRLQLGNIRQTISQSFGDTSLPGVDAFITQTFRKIVENLAELKSLMEALAVRTMEQESLDKNEYPRHLDLLDGMFDTLAFLEKHKNKLKSEEMDRLRGKLRALVKSYSSPHAKRTITKSPMNGN